MTRFRFVSDHADEVRRQADVFDLEGLPVRLLRLEATGRAPSTPGEMPSSGV